MTAQTDTTIAYVTRGWGGAAQTLQFAKRKHKRIINLGEEEAKCKGRKSF